MDAIAARSRTLFAVRLGGVVAAAVAIAACDSTNTRIAVGASVLQPSSVVAFSSTSVVAIQPQFLGHQLVPTFGCPLVPPFTTQFQIVIVQPNVDVTVNQVTIQFINGTNLGGTPIPFPQPNLTQMFGHTLVHAHTTRAFPFAQGFGCFPSSPKRMDVQVVLADANGATQQTMATADIQ